MFGCRQRCRYFCSGGVAGALGASSVGVKLVDGNKIVSNSSDVIIDRVVVNQTANFRTTADAVYFISGDAGLFPLTNAPITATVESVANGLVEVKVSNLPNITDAASFVMQF